MSDLTSMKLFFGYTLCKNYSFQSDQNKSSLDHVIIQAFCTYNVIQLSRIIYLLRVWTLALDWMRVGILHILSSPPPAELAELKKENSNLMINQAVPQEICHFASKKLAVI